METTQLGATHAAGAASAPTLLAVDATDLRKGFGSVRAVDGVTLKVRAGEIVAFLGPNGAGKTTTIDMLLGLSHPDSGEVRVFGETPRAAISHGLVSAVLQTGGLLKDITVKETLELTASLFADTRPVAEVMQRAGITEIAGAARRPVLGRPAAAPAVRDGAAVGSRTADPRRADHGNGCRGPPLLLGSHPRRCGPRAHRALRDALPRRGRRVRRPHRADEPRPHRRRRHDLRDQESRLRAASCTRRSPVRMPSPSRPFRASTRSRSRATASPCTRRTRMP